MSINMFVYQGVFECFCLSLFVTSMGILSVPGSAAYSLGFRPFWCSGKQKGGFPDAGSGVVTLSSSLVSLPASHLTNLHLTNLQLKFSLFHRDVDLLTLFLILFPHHREK